MTTHHGPLVLLAAGSGRRVGMPKGLMPVDGEAFLIWQIRRFASGGGQRVHLVLGPRLDDHLRCLRANHSSQPCLFKGVRISWSHIDHPGPYPFASLQIGLTDFLSRTDMAMTGFQRTWVSPIDRPLPKPSLWTHLEEAARQYPNPKLIAIRDGKRRIPPAGLSARFIADILASSPDARLDNLIKNLPDSDKLMIPGHDKLSRLDLDEVKDWRALRRLMDASGHYSA